MRKVRFMTVPPVSLDFFKNKLGDQFFEIDGRLGLSDFSSRRNEFIRPPWSDLDKLFSHQPFGLDGSDCILLNFYIRVETENNPGLIIFQMDPLHLSHFHPRKNNGGAGFYPSAVGEKCIDFIPFSSHNIHPSKFTGKVAQAEDTRKHE